ncbi:DNA-processing protein DprA [Pseudolysinimonas kribbensis]|uniref:DNA processing protein DprA n=1 Tax=Pseudolysinimonas kribbensis TaxID=433641 RepID=A0ABQ6K1Z3_9MICO|nr:DNA-processing protein DprA [Pseudolysinimonas kribbensis]GMA93952.1 DNA processing protein DprA [Pseudolysinimonas kribbensis]
MTILELPEASVAPLVRAVADAPDRAAVGERFARAAWSLVAEPGDGDAGRLVAELGAERAMAALVARVREEPAPGEPRIPDAALQRWRGRVGAGAVQLALRQAARFAAALVVPGDDDWPRGLDDLGEHAPFALWVRGDRAHLRALDRSIALVGARAATAYGEHVTMEAAAGLVDRRVAIVSGAAYGIDGAAHRAALASRGTTVAFLAGGVDRFYPAGHDQLLQKIVERGAVAAEVPCGVAPSKWRFLQRNRLIAAATQATVVVEAGWRSGSINTANHAAQLGRPVGVVPGPVTSSASAGCHRLLRESEALCVTTPSEMAQLLGEEEPIGSGVDADGGAADAPSPLDATRLRLLDAMSTRSGRESERIAIISGLAPDRVRAELGLLELEGLVRRRPSGWIRTVPEPA